MSKRTLYIPDDTWKRLMRLAAVAGVEEGRPVSISEYIPGLVEEKLK